MKKITLAIVLSLAMILCIVGPASAVTDGELDGNGHPQVVLILMEVGGVPMYRCSGTMISPYLVLTAGHCTSNFPDGVYSGMRIFTQSNVDAGKLAGENLYPNGDNDLLNDKTIEAVSWATLSGFESAPFFMNDVGIIVLAQPFYPGGGEGVYGKLPTAGQFDEFKTKRGIQKVTFTSVGYGLQKSFPTAAAWKDQKDKIRMVAHPKLIQINAPGSVGDFSLLLSNNAKTGGTCFGDSGGPNFLGDTNIIAGVTSFGKNGNCAGTGGVFRLDKQRVIDFVQPYLDQYPVPAP